MLIVNKLCEKLKEILRGSFLFLSLYFQLKIHKNVVDLCPFISSFCFINCYFC